MKLFDFIVMPAKAGLRLACQAPAYAGVALMFLAGPVHAEDAKAVTYSPPPCEFSVTFPDEPYKRQQCEDETKKETCFEKTSYTQVYELSSTVNFRVTCSPIGEDVIKNYSGEIMEATLKAMTESTVVKTYETSFREEEGYKQAGLVGEGKVGTMPTIYIAQLWIGKKSALSVEAEMIGEAHETADKLFSDVLKSVNYTAGKTEETQKEEIKKEEPKAEEKAEEKKEEEQVPKEPKQPNE